MAVNLKTLLKPLIDATRADGQAETAAKYENYLERLRQAGVQIPDDVPLNPPEDGEAPHK